jgi:hypothetical protein
MRKGIMFSFIIFFLAVTLVGFISVQRSLISGRREQLFVETRINALNNMYESAIRDVEKTLDTITRRAMIVCFNNITREGITLQQANVTLKELILNGTMNGEEEDIMGNNTFPYWMQKIEQVAILKGFNVTIDNQTIEQTLEIKPYDSFNLLVEAKMSINITDLQGVAALDRSVQIKSLVSVEGMEDPLYLLNSYGLMSNTITKSHYIGNYTQVILTGNNGGNNYAYGETTKDSTPGHFNDKILVVLDADSVPNLNQAKGVISKNPITGPITISYIVADDALNLPENINVLLDGSNDKVWYIDNFKKHAENSYYQSSQDGASYLDRLEGKLTVQTKYSSQSNNVIGLESFVNKNKIPPELTVYQEKTNIDYIYFSPGSMNGNKVKGISNSNWFRIDNQDQHQTTYGVNELIE